MVAKIKTNETGDCIFSEQDAIDLLYTNPKFDITKKDVLESRME